MKSCIRCNQSIEDNTNFCPKCGANQKNDNPTFLIVLCVMTILGSLFVMARGFLYEMVSTIGNDGDYIRGWIFFLTGIGTFVGALIMLKGKKLGLHIYSIFQIIYILTVCYTALIYNQNDIVNPTSISNNDIVKSISIGLAGFFVIPSIAILLLYWTKATRKHLF
jgi:hypothetical protein